MKIETRNEVVVVLHPYENYMLVYTTQNEIEILNRLEQNHGIEVFEAYMEYGKPIKVRFTPLYNIVKVGQAVEKILIDNGYSKIEFRAFKKPLELIGVAESMKNARWRNKKAKKPVLGKRTLPIKFLLAGNSSIKKEAVNKLFSHVGGKIDAIYDSVKDCKSDVNEQPEGEEEILRGAINRAISAHKKDPRGDVYIGIENGIKWIEELGGWYDYAIVLMYTPSYNNFSYARSRKVLFPSEQVYETVRKPGRFVLNTVGKTLQEDGIVKRHDDPHIDLCGTSRVDILTDALLEVVNYLPSELFLRNPQ